jgi:hypothetical protein
MDHVDPASDSNDARVMADRESSQDPSQLDTYFDTLIRLVPTIRSKRDTRTQLIPVNANGGAIPIDGPWTC